MNNKLDILLKKFRTTNDDTIVTGYMDDFFNKSKPKKTKDINQLKDNTTATIIKRPLPSTVKRKRYMSSSDESDIQPTLAATNVTTTISIREEEAVRIRKRRSLTPPPMELDGDFLNQYNIIKQNTTQPTPLVLSDTEDITLQPIIDLISDDEVILSVLKPQNIEIKFIFNLSKTSKKPLKPLKIKAKTNYEFNIFLTAISKKLKTPIGNVVLSFKGVKLSNLVTPIRLKLTTEDEITVWDVKSWEERNNAINESKQKLLESTSEEGEEEQEEEETVVLHLLKIRDNISKDPLKLKVDRVINKSNSRFNA